MSETQVHDLDELIDSDIPLADAAGEARQAAQEEPEKPAPQEEAADEQTGDTQAATPADDQAPEEDRVPLKALMRSTCLRASRCGAPRQQRSR